MSVADDVVAAIDRAELVEFALEISNIDSSTTTCCTFMLYWGCSSFGAVCPRIAACQLAAEIPTT